MHSGHKLLALQIINSKILYRKCALENQNVLIKFLKVNLSIPKSKNIFKELLTKNTIKSIIREVYSGFVLFF
jgi:hypothetical protein